MNESTIHVFWLKPLPDIPDPARILVAQDEISMVIALPDDTQLLITADRAVCIRGGYVVTIVQWQQAQEQQPSGTIRGQSTRVNDSLPFELRFPRGSYGLPSQR